MGLGRLYDADRRVGKMAGKGAQPVGFDQIIGVDHSNPFGAWVGLFQRKIQRAGLVTGPVRQMKEAQRRPGAGGEARPNIVFDRLPERRVGRVVVDNHHFNSRPIQRQQAVDGGDHHGRRLVAAGEVNADKRRRCECTQGARRRFVAQAAGPEQFGKFKKLNEQDGPHHGQRRDQHRQKSHVERPQIMA